MKKYNITISADSDAVIQRELSDAEYELIKGMAKEFEEVGDGWQGYLDIEECE